MWERHGVYKIQTEGQIKTWESLHCRIATLSHRDLYPVLACPGTLSGWYDGGQGQRIASTPFTCRDQHGRTSCYLMHDIGTGNGHCQKPPPHARYVTVMLQAWAMLCRVNCRYKDATVTGQQVAGHYIANCGKWRLTYSHRVPRHHQVQTTGEQVPKFSKKRLEILILFKSPWIGQGRWFPLGQAYQHPMAGD
jgi:hypothetical protein